MKNRPLLLKYIITAILLMMGITALMLSCRNASPVTSTVPEDTTIIRLIPVDSVQGQIPDIGQSLSIPSLDVELFRVSESTVLIKTPVRTNVRETVRILETKSRITFRNRTVDKSRTEVNSRNKKSGNQTSDSGNKTKTKTVSRQSASFPWWWWLIIAGAVAGYVYLKYLSPFRLL